MALKEYKRKRDFGKTPEPSARRGAKAGAGRFVIQKHEARATHYDLRLELDGVLKSWAVPKGPSLDPRDKRLAVHVEDHPIEYADFEGVIPEGQYGAGPVMVWDHGRWHPEGDAHAAYADGKIKFRLEGDRLKGRWMLVKTGGRSGAADPRHWLLIKERDDAVAPGIGPEVHTTSAKSGRTMEEIRRGARPSPAATKRNRRMEKPDAGASRVKGARRAPMPRSLRPQLAKPAALPPDGEAWIHEVKFDGYRILAFRDARGVRLLSRTGRDWSPKFPRLVQTIAQRLDVEAILDGEVVVLDSHGISRFQALQNALDSRRSDRVVYFAFDLPWCDSFDLSDTPLHARRDLLRRLIGGRDEGHLRFSEHFPGNGAAVFAAARRFGLEGIMSKRRDAPYRPTRTSTWLKVKCVNRQEFVVGGYTLPTGSREKFGALLVGCYDEQGRLRFAGKVGTGFSTETLHRLSLELEKIKGPRPPFADPPTGADARGVTWVEPRMVAEVEFLEWTGDGHIRQPAFQGIREDRKPEEIRREPTQAAAPVDPPARKPTRRAKPKAVPRGADQRLTHPDRVVFPDRGAGFSVTKRQVAEYYEAVAPWMLPHVAGRPLTIVRCPKGEGTHCFYQRHLAQGMPAGIKGVTIPDGEGPETGLEIRDIQGLVGLVQMNAIEIHAWGARSDNIERPDRMVLDLDPGPGVRWREVVEGARLVRDALREAGLTGFARTTGGKGLHIVVPLERRHTWSEVSGFAKAVADAFVRMSPRRFVAVATKSRREGRVYIDYLRNTRGANAVASYSTRARPGATVATPLAWDELSADLEPASLNVVSVRRRLESMKVDPWAGLARAAARLPSS